MAEKAKRHLWPVFVFIALCLVAGAGLYAVDRACSPSMPYLCWTPAGYEVTKPGGAPAGYRRHDGAAWHLSCGDACRQPAECYYYCCGGDNRIDRSGSPQSGATSCDCFPDGLPQPMGERSCSGRIGEMMALQRAADGADAAAQLKLAIFYDEEKRDIAAAFPWYSRAAENGSRVAQFRTGQLVEEGRGTPADCHAAMAWYEKAGVELTEEESRIADAAVTGAASAARNRLGEIYEKGLCGPVNTGEALRWQTMGEEGADPLRQPQLDHAKAMKLADLYMKGGEGLAKNPKEAMAWYRKAAALQNAGDARAEYELAMIYAKGDVVPQDFVKACHWYALAQRDQRYQSRNICDPIEPYLKPGDLDKIYPLIGRGALPGE